MCGIVGTASTEGMKSRSERKDFMRMGLDIDSWRGWESTGIALVENIAKSSPIVYKRALNGRDFIQLNHVEKYLNDIEKYPVVIGHNRAATTGRGNIIDHNAHPFQYGKITLVHNGHIRNTHDLPGALNGAECQVDSSHVAFSMNANGEMETLELVDGGFVFVWWNSELGTLNIARNTERPMNWAYAAKENTLYWASEFTQILHLMKDIEIDEDIGVLYPKPWNWYEFNLKDLREWRSLPFVHSHGRRSREATRRNTGPIGEEVDGWTPEQWEQWDRYGELGMNSTTSTQMDHITTLKGKSSSEEIEEIRQTVANQTLKNAKVAGVPTSTKRMNKAKMELKKLGIEYGALKNCTPVSWCKYKNQENLGSALVRTKREGLLIEVLQVKYENYMLYSKYNNLLVDCINVRRGPGNDVRVVATVSPKMTKYLEEQKRKEESNSEQETDKVVSIPLDFNGPNNSKITLDKFRELVRAGCAHCDGDILPIHHEFVIWVSDSRPICSDCARDPRVLELLGVEPTALIH